MKATHPRRADYGLDAPGAVRNLLIVAALGIAALTTRLLGMWSGQSAIAAIRRPLVSAGLACGAMALWMIYDSKIGKVRERETFLDKLDWKGNERVLDVGCGRGLFLIGAAKRLTSGRAVGIDKWQAEDLSGNTPSAPLDNAAIEGVADRRLPPASVVDVVQRHARHHYVEAGVFERQLAGVAGVPLHAIRDAFDGRVVERRGRRVAAEILSLPLVDTDRAAAGQALRRADQKQSAPASHVQDALVPLPVKLVEERLALAHLADLAVVNHP